MEEIYCTSALESNMDKRDDVNEPFGFRMSHVVQSKSSLFKVAAFFVAYYACSLKLWQDTAARQHQGQT